MQKDRHRPEHESRPHLDRGQREELPLVASLVCSENRSLLPRQVVWKFSYPVVGVLVKQSVLVLAYVWTLFHFVLHKLL